MSSNHRTEPVCVRAYASTSRTGFVVTRWTSPGYPAEGWVLQRSSVGPWTPGGRFVMLRTAGG
jgi:hypothetical protein